MTITTAATESTELSRSLVYLVSPRGGDNYWARVINGTDKVYLDTEGTLSVSIAKNGRYVLTCHNPFFEGCSVPMRKLAVIHEAGHLALRHLERVTRLLTTQADPLVRKTIQTIYNYALDFAVNDSILRKEPEFVQVHRPRGTDKGEFTFLLPEEFGYPKGLSVEEYVRLMLKDIDHARQVMREILECTQGDGDESKGGAGAESGGGRGGESESDSDPEGRSGTGGEGGESSSEKPNSTSGSGDQKNKSSSERRRGKGGGKAPTESDVEDPSLPPGLGEVARSDSESVDELQEMFDELNHENHDAWQDQLDNMSREEALSMANRMKAHARQLVRGAHEQTKRSRGFVPAEIEKMVERLLEADQTPWDWLLDDQLASSVASKVEEAMVMPNLSFINEDHLEPWPGLALNFAFNITWIDDISGSVSSPEHARACRCVNSLMASNKNVKLTYMQVDAALHLEEATDNLQSPDPEKLKEMLARRGAGGTVYTPAFKRILNVDTPSDWVRPELKPREPHPKPDLVIVTTDGGVRIEGECFPVYHPGCPIIWLVLPGNRPAPGMNDSAPDRVIEMFNIKSEF